MEELESSNQNNTDILSEEFIRERVDKFIVKNNLPLKNFALSIDIESVKRFTPYLVELNSLHINRKVHNGKIKGISYKNPNEFVSDISDVDLESYPYQEVPKTFTVHTSGQKVLLETVDTSECPRCEAHGAVTCHTCNGHGELKCGNCRGGKVTCGSFLGCGGKGRKIVKKTSKGGGTYETTEICRYCNGTGLEQCSKCNGTTIVQCHTCRGRGEVTCPTCDGYKYFQSYFYFLDNYKPEFDWKLFGEKELFSPAPTSTNIKHNVKFSKAILEREEYSDPTPELVLPEMYDEYIREVFIQRDVRGSSTHTIQDLIRFKSDAKEFDYLEIVYTYKDIEFYLLVDLTSDIVYFNNEVEVRKLASAESKAIQKIQGKSIFYPLQKKQLQYFNYILIKAAIYAIWMDGEIAKKEQEFFDMLLASTNVSIKQKLELKQLMDSNGVSFEHLKEITKDFYEKELIAILLWMISLVDGEMVSEENEKFMQLIETLGIPDERISHIRKIASRELRFYEKGNLSIARIRLDGKRDTSLTIVETEDKKRPQKNNYLAIAAFIGIVTFMGSFHYLFKFSNSLGAKLESYEESLKNSDYNRASVIEEELSKITPNHLYDTNFHLNSSLALFKGYLSQNDFTKAELYLNRIRSNGYENYVIVNDEDGSYSEAIKKFETLKKENK